MKHFFQHKYTAYWVSLVLFITALLINCGKPKADNELLQVQVSPTPTQAPAPVTEIIEQKADTTTTISDTTTAK